MLLVGAAVGAALAINAGYVVQHDGLTRAPRIDPRRPLAAIAALARSRRWVAGALLGYAGLGLELVALTALPLSAVQATVGAGLVVVAVLSRALGGAPLGRAAPLGAALAIAALGVVAVVTPGVAARPSPAPAPWALAAAAALVAGAAGLAARRLRSATGLALAAGLLYGMTSIAMAALAPMLAGTTPALAVAAVALPIGAAVTAAGFLSFQRALQRGQPLPVVTVMMAAMDVVAIAGGIVVLGDPLASGAAARIAQVAALALAALSAVVVLRERPGEPAPAQEGPGLAGGGHPELRPGIGRVGSRPGVRAADEPQMGDRRPVAARRPVEA
jgi:drug/metabolite transporter (DMT)-like permease